MDRATEVATRNPHPVSRYKPYVVQEKDAKMMVRADATATGIVTSHTTRMTHKPRTRTIATECVSIMPNGTRKPFAPAQKRTSNVAGVVRRTAKVDNAGTYADRLARFGADNTDY
jgi:hypothetical protein